MDLNALLAQLKAPADGQASDSSQAQSSNYLPPFVSSPLGSPPVASPQPQSLNRAASGILSPANAPTTDRSDRTANLLNLLKFNQPSSTGIGGQVGRDQNATRTFSAAAIENSSAGTIGSSAGRSASMRLPSSVARGESPRPSISATPQDLLLKLLNPTQNSAPLAEKSIEHTAGQESLGNQSDTNVATPTSTAPPSRGRFTYVNPFEQLAASSPRNKSAKPTSHDDGRAILQTTVSFDSSQVEALLGNGAKKSTETTVSQALDQVGLQADRDAEEAIERANGASATVEAPTMNTKEVQQAIHDAALDIKKELEDDVKKEQIEAIMPQPVAKAFEKAVNDIAQETVADSWESADAEELSPKEETETGVRVLNFPMKPFVAIDLIKLPIAREIRQDIVMKIASMKKEFDQVDRTLASATSDFIVYALARGGGIRIIRQDDGANKQVFRKAGNDMYNVDISAPASSASSKTSHTVLATGVNGSVFWTAVNVGTDEPFDDEDIDNFGLIFPPLPSPEDNNPSGGQLKTRAKLSSRHPEFFAVSRGKSIHIIWPSLASTKPYLDDKTRVVDTEKYLSERCLKVSTGKSGKDFAFSEDDTVIASLDKVGRLKFWDIREHIDPTGSTGGAYRHVETKTPLMIIPTTSAADKSWATSVLFVDKERPMTKGVALRYLLVGSKQNHTLQLWDLGLGKPVQEINFPHENENDAICSVCYHAKSGIIAVGHPTRNSVFFIYLSAPRYNLGTINQAEFIKRLATEDNTLPRPESTAIMTGIRELSLASLGQLRSLRVTEAAPPNVKPNDGEATLFEVYVAHSKGIASLDIKKQDLGWDNHGKVIDPVNAAAEKIIEVKDLGALQSSFEAAEVSDSKAKPAESEIVPSEEPEKAQKDAFAPPPPAASSQATTSAVEATAEVASRATAEVAPEETADAFGPTTFGEVTEEKTEKMIKPVADAVNATLASSNAPSAEAPAESLNIDATQLGETISKALGNTLSVIFGSVLGEQLETLYKRIDDDKRVTEASGAAKQDAILRLISSTLTDNVEKSLTRIVSSNIEKTIIPAMNSVTSDAIKQQLVKSIPEEIKASLQAPIAKALQEPALMKIVADVVSGKVAAQVDSVFTATLTKTIVPAFQKLAVDTARKVTSEVEQRVTGQLQKINVQHQSDGAKIDRLSIQHQTDSAKIDQLTTLTMQMLDSVRGMTDQLAEARAEIAGLKLQLAEQKTQVASAPATAAAAAPEDAELANLTELMSGGRLVEATIKWLQSARRVELFDKLFARYDSNYLKDVDQLITLSVCAAVTDAFDTNFTARLKWLEVAMTSINAQDPVVAEHVAKVMDVLVQRLSDLYMAIAEREPSNAVLVKIHSLVRLAKDIKLAA